ncbi:MAG: 3-oxoacyl-[acyl-carrier-protein] synthase 3 [Nitrosomonadaceae bacterium]|nr:3-oxoacyl-[acyl-carrier-protein] synthase 3 [Nitrosomonadaceae bacterium]
MQVESVGLRAISVSLPKRIETNQDLSLSHPEWRMELVERKTGVFQRHVAESNETALDLASKACRDLFAAYESLSQRVDGIIFCTQTPDYVMPPNACLLHDSLGLGDAVMAFDTNLACSGYVYSLVIAQSLISTGTCTNILVVTADTYSKLISPGDRSVRALFGDGAAVTWVAEGSEGKLIDAICETSGSGFRNFYIPAGGMRNPFSQEFREENIDSTGNHLSQNYIHMNGMGVLSFANSKVPSQVRRLLGRNSMGIHDIDLVVFHQGSKLAIDSLTRLLNLSDGQVFRNIATVGNTVSASIPIALSQAISEGRARPGDLVLLCGFGVGLSWASALIRL